MVAFAVLIVIVLVQTRYMRSAYQHYAEVRMEAQRYKADLDEAKYYAEVLNLQLQSVSPDDLSLLRAAMKQKLELYLGASYYGAKTDAIHDITH